jgi:hypothetical protein
MADKRGAYEKLNVKDSDKNAYSSAEKVIRYFAFIK